MNQETYQTNVSVADPELARRKSGAAKDSVNDKEISEETKKEINVVNGIMNARKRYGEDRIGKEREWTESFKMYMSWVDRTANAFVSNLFIPKTHEAVELLAAFLIGNNQNISATPEAGSGDVTKARIAGKWLDYLWRKVFKARIKILVWIKQGIIFGNGYLKLGYDVNTKAPWMSVCAIEDIYVDYFEPDAQESEYLIHEIRKDRADVMKDPKYDLKSEDGKLIREQVIVGGESFDQSKALFSTYDGSMVRSECRDKVLVLEAWCIESDGSQRLKTLLPTSCGWRVARDVENPNRWRNKDGKAGDYFRPFPKLRFKTAALPNRAYDMSAVFPTVHIQKAFNDLMRQYFDSVQLINAPMWKKRRGARINPSELVRRPGGVITVGDIDKDLAQDSVSDIKQSMIEMLNRLDREFQEASMVVNLIKGMSQSETATGDALAQQNVQTLLDMINQNIVDALSEAGQMALAISLSNDEGVKSLVMYDNEQETASIDFELKNIDGMHEIRIVPDRTDNTTKASQNKGLIQFLNLVAADAGIVQQYPSLKKKLYKRFLENTGSGDANSFFEEEAPAQNTQPDAMPILSPGDQMTAKPNAMPVKSGMTSADVVGSVV